MLDLPEAGRYASGLVFLPKNDDAARKCVETLGHYVEQEGLTLIGWRDVPVDSSCVGEIALRNEPRIRQIFIGSRGEETDKFERKLYMVRKQAEIRVRQSNIIDKESYYVVSLSSRTFIYKGMLTPKQLGEYFLDLRDPKVASAIAVVHSRFSTNTFPTWDLAQPFRMIAHNGEINTIRGNRLWMQAREGILQSDLFGDDLKKCFPIVEPDMSDSASFDNVFEFLVQAGSTMPQALTMMVPESWNDKNPIPDSLKAYYEYHSTIMEPWDGPAALVFTDGHYVGGTLDRNGLRPSRYVITKDGMIVMGSEVGVQIFEPEEIKEKGRLKPGKLLHYSVKMHSSWHILPPLSKTKAAYRRMLFPHPLPNGYSYPPAMAESLCHAPRQALPGSRWQMPDKD